MGTNWTARARTAGNTFDPDCPSRVILDRIGDKWTVLVVQALSAGTLRFSQLRTQVGGVAPKVLTQTLRSLERDGLITRKVYAQVPPKVEYRLTPLGRSLLGPLRALNDWAEGHISAVLAARERADA